MLYTNNEQITDITKHKYATRLYGAAKKVRPIKSQDRTTLTRECASDWSSPGGWTTDMLRHTEELQVFNRLLAVPEPHCHCERRVGCAGTSN